VLSQAGAPLSWTSERADTLFVCERRRSRRILDVRAADLEEEMTNNAFRSVISDEDGGNQANIAAREASP
jgi:hypothetical protein